MKNFCEPECKCKRHSFVPVAAQRAALGRPKSTEHKQKLSDAQKRFNKEHPEKARFRSQALSGRKRPAHSEETKEKMRASALARHTSSTYKEARSTWMKQHMATCDGNCRVIACRPRWRETQIERTLVEQVLIEFPEVITQKKFGRFRVDAYLPPPYHLAFEADGAYWHTIGAVRDAARDAELLQQFELPVIRLTEQELTEIRRRRRAAGFY